MRVTWQQNKKRMTEKKKKHCRLFFCMSHPFKVKSGAPSRHSVCGPSVGGTPPWISQRESREEKFVAPQLQLMKSPSINDECQTQQAVQPAKKTRIGCKPWSQQGSKHDVAQHCEGSQEQMSLCPFKHFPNCGSSHLRCRSSCHFLSLL